MRRAQRRRTDGRTSADIRSRRTTWAGSCARAVRRRPRFGPSGVPTDVEFCPPHSTSGSYSNSPATTSRPGSPTDVRLGEARRSAGSTSACHACGPETVRKPSRRSKRRIAPAVRLPLRTSASCLQAPITKPRWPRSGALTPDTPAWAHTTSECSCSFAATSEAHSPPSRVRITGATRPARSTSPDCAGLTVTARLRGRRRAGALERDAALRWSPETPVRLELRLAGSVQSFRRADRDGARSGHMSACSARRTNATRSRPDRSVQRGGRG